MKFTWYHFLFAAQLVAASPRHSSPFPPVTSTSPYEETSSLRELKKRQTTLSSPAAAATTCGYLSGDANLPVTGGPGSSCAIDTTHDLWGICPSTALIGSPDCNLPAFCVDVLSCVGTCPWNSIGSTTTQADSTGGILTCTESGADLCGLSMLLWNNVGFASLICTTTTESISNYLALSNIVLAEATFTPSPSNTPSSAISSGTIGSILPDGAVTSSQNSPTSSASAHKSSKSSSKTPIIVGVLVPLLLLALVGAAILIRRYRKKRLGRLGDSIDVQQERKQSQGFIPHGDNHGVAYELPVEERPFEISAIRSPVEIGPGRDGRERL